MSKILKNTTGSDIEIDDTGITILQSPGQYTIPPQEYNLWAASDDVITFIGDSTLVVNDGSVDLGISDGTDLIKGIFQKQRIIGDTDSTLIGNVGDRLKVTTGQGAGNGTGVSAYNKNLRYDDINVANGGVARDTSVGTSFTDIYSYTGSGVLVSWILHCQALQDWTVQLEVDGEDIFGTSGLSMDDFLSTALYGFGALYPTAGGLRRSSNIFQWCPEMEVAIVFDTSIKIKAKTSGEKQFKAGLVVISKD